VVRSEVKNEQVGKVEKGCGGTGASSRVANSSLARAREKKCFRVSRRNAEEKRSSE